MNEELLDAVADELLQAIEKKDKKMLCEALQALVMHISDKDEQDEAMDEHE